MELADISGTTEISGEGIKKHFKSIDPWQPIFELVWNGLDAKSNSVRVAIEKNTLGTISLVSILDDGEGIEPGGLKNTFGRFNDSNKKEDASLHGAHGRGRLAFHRICNRATWFTNSLSGQAKIQVLAGDIKRFAATRLRPEEQHQGLAELQTGTLVELDQFTAPIPDANDLRKKFSVEFGWYLALHPS